MDNHNCVLFVCYHAHSIYIGRCFYFLDAQQPWSKNVGACVAVDMHPMSVTDDKLQFVVNQMSTDDGKMVLHTI